MPIVSYAADREYDATPCYCGNCDWKGLGGEIEVTLHMIHHLAERLDPGGEVPMGDCPECGALAYKA